ncbi:hypothetical protein L915_21829 [Phytophthora nicotianae]|uniref:Uncharacterized protein n=1 Tax=Phytophthora nicotianae TaxID=4792 RepID=W2JBN5_PHYNI|nr:hypothetical protein L915_21829 [Phytophthora nicotianae]ETL43835.1 hypothetical protein L916_05751 [Phytophthora nicotianae]
MTVEESFDQVEKMLEEHRQQRKNINLVGLKR